MKMKQKQKNQIPQSHDSHITAAMPIHGVDSSCYICGKKIESPEEQCDMYGEVVCQDCWDYNMYQALQDGRGM